MSLDYCAGAVSYSKIVTNNINAYILRLIMQISDIGPREDREKMTLIEVCKDSLLKLCAL